MRNHFADARTAARTQAWMTRLRAMDACRWSSNDENGGMKLSFSNMVRAPRPGGRTASRPRGRRRMAQHPQVLPTERCRGFRNPFKFGRHFLEVFSDVSQTAPFC